MSKIYVDVTNTLNVNFITGIQRVVRKFGLKMTQLDNVVFLKKLEKSEFYDTLTGYQFTCACADREWEDCEGNERAISLDSLAEDDIFFDMDSVWNNYEERRALVYKKLKKQGVRIITLVYDVLPITMPQFFHTDTLIHYLQYFYAVLSYSDYIIVNAEATKRDIEIILRECGLSSKEIRVVPLGADVLKEVKEQVHTEGISQTVIQATERPFLMMLGTIEPRKNHTLLLDAYDSGIRHLPVNIVIAGRVGWNVDELLERMNNHPDLNSRIFFIESPSDVEVEYLYEKCWAVVFPSFGEGFGLPIIEALYHQKLVFASDVAVCREVGKKACVYFNHRDPLNLVECIAGVIANRTREQELYNNICEYHASSWDEASDILLDVLCEMEREKDSTQEHFFPEVGLVPKQLYILSSNEKNILETLPYFEHFMPFIDEVVIGCPQHLEKVLQRDYSGRLQLKTVSDEYLLRGKALPADHQERNLLLRALAIQSDFLDDVFIMADDDNRPMREVPVSFFIEKKKFNLYYCNEDICDWRAAIDNPTSYDRGIHHTAEFLKKYNLPRRQYSSHAPQIICKRIYREILAKYEDEWHTAIDEWSLYGNYMESYYSNYVQSLPYVTMNWPATPIDWKVTILPREYVFENFYRDLYEPGNLFENYSTELTENILTENMSKAQIRMTIQDDYASGEKVADACDELYYRMFHIAPVWRIDLDHSKLSVPKVLIGAKGHIRKVPFQIVNRTHVGKLVIEGWFEESETGVVYQFKNEVLNTSEMDGDFALTIHYPDWDRDGELHITFTVNDSERVGVTIPVITFA